MQIAETARMSAVEKLSGVDRAWLLMDRPANPMMIIGLIVLEGHLERLQLRDLVAERFLRHRRFRCVPVTNPMGGGNWVEATPFDIDDHVLSCALPEPRTQRELEALMGQLASAPLCAVRPLWTFHLVERYRHGSAIIVRIHHAYADGIALLRVLLSLTDSEGTATGGAPPAGASAAAAPASERAWLTGPLADALRGGANMAEKAVHYVLHPEETSGIVRQALDMAGELAHVGLLADDPLTRLKRPLSGIRRAAWADPLPLAEIRTLASVLGCTVNDLLMSTLAGALGRYLESHGEDVSGMTIRAAVPVNLRADDGAQPALGNCFGLVFVDLPIGTRHPLERLYGVRTAMQKLKGSPQALVILGLLTLLGNLPAPVEEPVIKMFSTKASLVASNLPGPRMPLRLAGKAVSQVLFWVPQAGDIGVGVSMLSYQGSLHFGIIADREVIPRPHELIEKIHDEFERLVYLLLLGARSTAH